MNSFDTEQFVDMKSVLALLFFVIFGACNTPYYSSPNSMLGQPASLYLIDGRQINGKIAVRTFDDYSSVARIQFSEGATNQYRDYFIEDIQSIYMNGSVYQVKLLIGSQFWGGDALRLVKRLSAENGRMAMFEHEKMFKNATTGKMEKITEFFLQLPNSQRREIYNAESAKFTHNFDDKMAAIVVDCHELAAKIKSKHRDYFYPFLANNSELRRRTVLLQIINEYNSCKQ